MSKVAVFTICSLSLGQRQLGREAERDRQEGEGEEEERSGSLINHFSSVLTEHHPGDPPPSGPKEPHLH